MAESANLLKSAGLVPPAQIKEAQRLHKSQGGTLGLHLVRIGAIQPTQLAHFYHQRLKVPRVDRQRMETVSPKVLALLPVDLAAELRVVPIDQDKEGNLTLAMADPAWERAASEVGFFTGMFIVRAVASEDDIDWALVAHYGVEAATTAPAPLVKGRPSLPPKTKTKPPAGQGGKKTSLPPASAATPVAEPTFTPGPEPVVQAVSARMKSEPVIIGKEKAAPEVAVPAAPPPASRTPVLLTKAKGVAPEETSPQTPAAISTQMAAAPAAQPAQQAKSTSTGRIATTPPAPRINTSPPGVVPPPAPPAVVPLETLKEPIDDLVKDLSKERTKEPAREPIRESAKNKEKERPVEAARAQAPAPVVAVPTGPLLVELEKAVLKLQHATEPEEVGAQALAMMGMVCERAVFWIIKKRIARPWGTSGATVGSLEALEFPIDAPSLFRKVILSGEPFEGRMENDPVLQLVQSGLGGACSHAILAPVAARNRPVAFIYGDNLRESPPADMVKRLVTEMGAAYERMVARTKAT